MIRLFLCETRERKRSIVCLCEHSALRRFVQKELIRIIFTPRQCQYKPSTTYPAHHLAPARMNRTSWCKLQHPK